MRMEPTKEELEENAQEIMQEFPNVTREMIALWDTIGEPAKPGEIARDYSRRRRERLQGGSESQKQ